MSDKPRTCGECRQWKESVGDDNIGVCQALVPFWAMSVEKKWNYERWIVDRDEPMAGYCAAFERRDG